MALSQIQIIQSLGEALAWFEKELAWGVSEAELRHLTGRIGELYAAMITRGQMALETNQRGYDVVTAENERVSVKTVTSSNHVTFNAATLEEVDRIMVLRLNVDEDDGVSIESLLDSLKVDALAKMKMTSGKFSYSVTSGKRSIQPIENLRVVQKASYDGYEIFRYENGTIRLNKDGTDQTPVKPHLRDIAGDVGVDLQFESGADKNTRHLGAQLIKQINSR